MAPTILICFIHIITASIMFSKTLSFSLPMIPIDSIHSQILPNNFTTHQRHQLLFNITLSRASLYPLKKVSNISRKTLEVSVLRKLSNYFVTQLSFGTGSNRFTPFVLLDTGDDKTWVQCHGCNPCFPVMGGNIRAQNSPSYKLLSTVDPRCESRYSYRGVCGYISNYGDGSVSTMGMMGTDTFRFINSQTRETEIFPNVAFGCGMKNINIAFGLNTGLQNTISGVFGLSPGPQSFLNQLDAAIQGRFSYCLTSWADSEPAQSTMYFGDDAKIQGPNVQQIPMNAKYRYHLYFRGISVDGIRLPIDPSICSFEEDNRGLVNGFFIDSGAPYTILPVSAYIPLKMAVFNYFAKYGWGPVGGHTFDLCYLSTPKEGQYYPKVVFHFGQGDQRGEVDWVMNHENMFEKLNQVDGFCMVVAYAPDPGPCLFGAYQQANFRILYDVRNWMLYFAPQRCQEHNTLG